jgi:hypothetical protein
MAGKSIVSFKGSPNLQSIAHPLSELTHLFVSQYAYGTSLFVISFAQLSGLGWMHTFLSPDHCIFMPP